MGKDNFRFEYDAYQAMKNAPKLLGMELVQRGKQLEGPYYLNGDRHPYRKDKLKIYIQNGTVWVSEEGGECVSLTTWLLNYGGAADFKEAMKMINGQSQALSWNHEVRQKAVAELRYVPWEAVNGAAAYDLNKCSLFRWMCTLFPEDKVREAWREYNVTTDSHGNVVYWYVNQQNKVLFDKRIFYKEDGHRDRNFFPGRQYRVRDGYSDRCYFGAHLPDDGKKAFILESEKSCLLARLYYGRRFLATGGKGNLREIDKNVLLLPDMDSREEWSSKGEVWPWWEKFGVPIEQIPDHADIGDLIAIKQLNNKKNE